MQGAALWAAVARPATRLPNCALSVAPGHRAGNAHRPSIAAWRATRLCDKTAPGADDEYEPRRCGPQFCEDARHKIRVYPPRVMRYTPRRGWCRTAYRCTTSRRCPGTRTSPRRSGTPPGAERQQQGHRVLGAPRWRASGARTAAGPSLMTRNGPVTCWFVRAAYRNRTGASRIWDSPADSLGIADAGAAGVRGRWAVAGCALCDPPAGQLASGGVTPGTRRSIMARAGRGGAAENRRRASAAARHSKRPGPEVTGRARR